MHCHPVLIATVGVFPRVAENQLSSDEALASVLRDSRGQQFPAAASTLPQSAGGSGELGLPSLWLFLIEGEL